MASTLEHAKGLLDEIGYNYVEHGDDTLILNFRTEQYQDPEGDQVLMVALQLPEDGQLLYAFTPHPLVTVSASHLESMASTCMQIQWKTPLVKYEIDEDGEVRLVVATPLAGAELTATQLQRCVSTLAQAADVYHDAIVEAAGREASADDDGEGSTEIAGAGSDESHWWEAMDPFAAAGKFVVLQIPREPFSEGDTEAIEEAGSADLGDWEGLAGLVGQEEAAKHRLDFTEVTSFVAALYCEGTYVTSIQGGDEDEAGSETESGEPVEAFRRYMASQTEAMRLPKGKPYGNVSLGGGCEVGFHVRRDHVSIYFLSSGKIPPERVGQWIREQGLEGSEMPGGELLEPFEGKRNPSVVRVESHIPLPDKGMLETAELREKARLVVEFLLSSFSGISTDLGS